MQIYLSYVVVAALHWRGTEETRVECQPEPSHPLY